MATEAPERRIDPLDGVAYTRDELFAFYKKQKYAKLVIESYWQGLTPVNSLGEKRIDPINGVAYTFEELSLFYKGTYKKKDIKSYWDACILVKPKKQKKQQKKGADADAEPGAKEGAEGAKKKELRPQRDAHFEGFTLEQLGLHTTQPGREGHEEAEARAHQGFQHELERSWGSDYHLNFSVHDVIERFLEKRCAEKSYASLRNGGTPVEVETVVISHPNANFGETLDCIKAAMMLYNIPEPLYMKMFSQAHGEQARLYRKHRPPVLTKLLREGGVKEVIVLHPDIPAPFNICDKSWMVFDIMTAVEVGCAVRHVGLPRVLREVLDHIDVGNAVHGPKRKGAKKVYDAEKDPFRVPIEEFGVERLNQIIKDGIRETLDGFRDHSFQKVDGKGFGPAHWAMTVNQLRALRDEMHSSFPDVFEELTMRDVVDKVIIPKTQGTGMGWALLHNKESPLSPEYLVSHAWDETFDEMVEALAGAGLTDDQRIWVCALALYQPNDGDGPSISDQLGLDVKEGPFAQILHMPDLKGMVAVHTAKCDLYSRLWCDYEFLEAVQSGVNVIFAGDEKVIQQQGKIDCRTATCGAPSEFMVEDTRKIRRIIEQTWGSRTATTPTARGSRKFPSGSEAYEVLNEKIFQFREKCRH